MTEWRTRAGCLNRRVVETARSQKRNTPRNLGTAERAQLAGRISRRAKAPQRQCGRTPPHLQLAKKGGRRRRSIVAHRQASNNAEPTIRQPPQKTGQCLSSKRNAARNAARPFRARGPATIHSIHVQRTESATRAQRL